MADFAMDSFVEILSRPYAWPFRTMAQLAIAWRWWQAMAFLSFAVQLRPELVVQ